MIEGSKLNVIVIGIFWIVRYINIVKFDGQNLSVKSDWPKKLSVTCDWEPPITHLLYIMMYRRYIRPLIFLGCRSDTDTRPDHTTYVFNI